MSRRPLYILGTSGLAREMAQLVATIDARSSRWFLAGFIGDGTMPVGTDLGWGRVVGTDDWLLSAGEEADIVAGIGYPAVRARVIERYVHEGARFGFPALVHPTAILDPRHVVLGRGTVVTAGCVLTCDITLGNFTLLNWNVTVGHDAVIGDSCVINPSANVSGNVTIDDEVLVGTGAQILERLRVGRGASVGAGAVVTRDVEPGLTVVGVPARAAG